jgi:hypothetical protein
VCKKIPEQIKTCSGVFDGLTLTQQINFAANSVDAGCVDLSEGLGKQTAACNRATLRSAPGIVARGQRALR